jgi:hypothetical protein
MIKPNHEPKFVLVAALSRLAMTGEQPDAILKAP